MAPVERSGHLITRMPGRQATTIGWPYYRYQEPSALYRDQARGRPDSELDAGEIDLAVGGVPAPVRRWHERQPLGREEHVCLFNPDLVLVRAPVSVEDFTRYPHLMPSLTSETESFVDEVLEVSTAWHGRENGSPSNARLRSQVQGGAIVPGASVREEAHD